MKPIYLKPDQSLLFLSYAPYRPGEECYVREALHKGINISSSEYCSIHYPDDTPVLFKDGAFMGMFGRAIWQWGGLRLPIIAMPQWASRRHVRIVSCEPIRVEDVTWQDAIKAGVEAKYCCSGVDCACMGLPIDNPADDFRENWHKKHPGKQWAWRVETTNIKGEQAWGGN
jgi:hypothetical protein